MTVSGNLQEALNEVPCRVVFLNISVSCVTGQFVNFAPMLTPNQSNEMLRVHKLNDEKCSGHCNPYCDNPTQSNPLPGRGYMVIGFRPPPTLKLLTQFQET